MQFGKKPGAVEEKPQEPKLGRLTRLSSWVLKKRGFHVIERHELTPEALSFVGKVKEKRVGRGVFIAGAGALSALHAPFSGFFFAPFLKLQSIAALALGGGWHPFVLRETKHLEDYVNFVNPVKFKYRSKHVWPKLKKKYKFVLVPLWGERLVLANKEGLATRSKLLES